jgi:adhesin transport system outer membrane protein
LCLAASPLLAQNRQTLGWVEAIEQALKTNQSLAAAQEDLQAQRENISIARANFFPWVGVGASFSESRSETFSEHSGIIPSSTGMVGAKLSQMIYDEKTFANYTVQKDLFASQEEQLRNTRFSIISIAGQAFISVLLAEDLRDIQIANRELTENNLEMSRIREEAGATSLQEVLRWQTQLYSNEQSVAEQDSRALASRFELNQVRNRPAEEHLTLERLTVKRDGFIFSSEEVAKALLNPEKARRVRDYLVELGLADSPLISSLDREIAAQQRSLDSNRRWLIPSFSFNAGADAFMYGSGDGPDYQELEKGFWKLGVSMNWNIFDGGANFSEIHQASAELRALQSQRNELVSSVEKAVRTQAARTIADFQNITFALAQVEAAEENYRLVLDSYFVGEISLLDLLDAQNELLGANASETAALYTFLADLLSLEQSMGYFPFLEPKSEVDNIIRELERRLQTP